MRFCAFVAVALLIAACAPPIDLTKVAEFSNDTAQASKSFDSLSADYYDSCARSAEYRTLNDYAKTLPGPGAPRAIEQAPIVSPTFVPLNQLPAVTPPTPMPAASPAIAPASSPEPLPPGPCAKAAAISQAWKASNDIVVGYVEALGAIAGAQTQTENYGFDKLTGELKGLKPAQQQGIASLATTIANDFTAAKARGDIATFVLQADDSLHYAVATLQNEIDQAYLQQLSFERGYEADAIRAQLSGGPSAYRVAAVRAKWANQLTKLGQRQQAALAYRSALQTILTSQEALKKAAEDKSLSRQALATIAGDAGSSLLDDVSTIEKAFNR